jgi:hypothetical protein
MMVDLNEVSTDELIAELKARDELPEPRLTDFDDYEIEGEYEARELGVAEYDATLQDEDSLDKAVNYARWGDFDSCSHFLIRAIPGLYPIQKVLSMTEIASFNALFASAASRGLRLNRFDQDSSGLFRANWRRDGDRAVFFPVAEHAQPFLAVLNAYVLADLQAPTHGSPELDEDAAKLEAMGQDAGPTFEDLFG